MRNILVILFLLLVSACGTAVPTIKPYQLDIQQGNVVTSKMLLQLRPGMTKSQVRYIMGTPLIQDSFHGNRWDYFYQMREAGKVIEQRRVILDFDNELLKTVRGDVVPSEGEKSNQTDLVTGTRVVEPEVKAEEKGFFDKLKFWKKDEAELAKEAEAEKADLEKKLLEKSKLEKEALENEALAKENAQKMADEEEKKAAETAQSKPSEPAIENMLPVEKVKSAVPEVVEKTSAEKSMPAQLPDQKASEEKAPEENSGKSWWQKLKFWKSNPPKVEQQNLPAEDVKSLSGVPIIEVPEAGATSQNK